MKYIYMPKEQQLQEMENLGVDIYKYLIIKTAESLIADGKNYQCRGILKCAYNYLQNNVDIAHAVCLLYPEEIKYSQVAQYDVKLCEQLINMSQDRSIYSLDNLVYFSNDNLEIITKVISKLDELLPERPEYRFEYLSSELLEDIFSTRILQKLVYLSQDMMEKLSRIEPAYAMLFNVSDEEKGYLLSQAMDAYVSRYGIDCKNDNKKFSGDIEWKHEQDVKRLIKYSNKASRYV